MLTHSTESTSKHGRLFELIRQKNQADTVVARVGEFHIRKISKAEMLMLQQAAARSLKARP